MIFSSFFDEFPELLKTEIRYVEFSDIPIDSTSLIPEGRYAFFEYFCTDKNCTCKKAIINVIEGDIAQASHKFTAIHNQALATTRWWFNYLDSKPQFHLHCYIWIGIESL